MSTPNDLLVYYGWPSAINGASTIEEATAEFDRYDYAIFGAGLEEPTHPDHERTKAIIAKTRPLVFGYIDLGVATSGYPMRKVKRKVRRWSEMGVFGIFYDDFGHDYGVSRPRQNRAVNYAHSFEMPVMVNAWKPEDVFEGKTAVGPGDIYFFESFYIKNGTVDGNWRGKADRVATYQRRLGFEVASVTTTDPSNAFSPLRFHAAWEAAACYGHEAMGWGEYLYSIDSNAPYRERPQKSP